MGGIIIKNLIFDFDGTLVDSKDLAISAINQMAEKHNFRKIAEEEIEYLRKLSIAERCIILNVPLYKLPFWAGDFYSLYKESMKNLTLFKGIKELLAELNNLNYNLAVISSNSEKIIKEFFDKNSIDYIQDVFCSSNLFGKDKVIAKFLKKKGIKKSEVIYIGDEQRDIIACKRIGIKIIWVKWGFDTIDLVQKETPDYIADSPQDIIDLLHKEKSND